MYCDTSCTEGNLSELFTQSGEEKTGQENKNQQNKNTKYKLKKGTEVFLFIVCGSLEEV